MFERATLRPRGAALLMQPNGISALEAIDPALVEGLMAMDPHMGPYWWASTARLPPPLASLGQLTPMALTLLRPAVVWGPDGARLPPC